MAESPKKKVLKLLAKEWDHAGPPGILEIGDIVTVLALAPSETLQTLKQLYQEGLVDMNRLKTSAFLTPEGYAAAEKQ
jgi:Mn-dependent DtxR family transcriptional regulator